MRIVAVAPTRIGLVGGGTDVDPFSLKFGGRVLSIAIDLTLVTRLTPTESSQIEIEALGGRRVIPSLRGALAYGKDPQFDLVRAILNHFRHDVPSGFFLTTEANFESVGLGGSGSAAVSIIGCLNHWLKRGMSRIEIATLAFLMENQELGWPGGIQDQMSAAFGGINIIPFGFGQDLGAVPLDLEQDTLKEFRTWMMIAFLGGWRHSKEQQESLIKGMSEEEKLQALIRLRDSVDRAAGVIKGRDWESLGVMMDEAWEDKKKSNPLISNKIIDDFYSTAKHLGMIGGKLMGAGGAGHLFMVVPPRKQLAVKEALVQKGARMVDFGFDFLGLRVREER